jgi:hypothetical protein
MIPPYKSLYRLYQRFKKMKRTILKVSDIIRIVVSAESMLFSLQVSQGDLYAVVPAGVGEIEDLL